MGRRVINILAVVSLALLLATVVLWVESYRGPPHPSSWYGAGLTAPPANGRTIKCCFHYGNLEVVVIDSTPRRPANRVEETQLLGAVFGYFIEQYEPTVNPMGVMIRRRFWFCWCGVLALLWAALPAWLAAKSVCRRYRQLRTAILLILLLLPAAATTLLWLRSYHAGSARSGLALFDAPMHQLLFSWDTFGHISVMYSAYGSALGRPPASSEHKLFGWRLSRSPQTRAPVARADGSMGPPVYGSLYELDIPYWIVTLGALLFALPPAARLTRAIRRSRRLHFGLCPTCGYDLRAHKPGDCCPECGEPIAVS